jgi:hypothetical protein
MLDPEPKMLGPDQNRQARELKLQTCEPGIPHPTHLLNEPSVETRRNTA